MPLSAWLLVIPQWLSALLVFGAFILFSSGLLFSVRHFVHHSVLKPHNDIAGFVSAIVSAIYGVMLAFVVSDVWEQYNDASTITDREASSAFALYRDLNLYPHKQASDKAISALREFTLLVVKKEFAAIQRMQWASKAIPDNATQAAAGRLHETIRGIIPNNLYEQALFNDILAETNSLTERRMQRLLMARTDLPGEIWLMVILGAIITVGFVSLFGHENLRLHVILATLLSITTGSAVYVIINLNYPFLGEVCVRPDGYEYLIDIARW